MAKIEVVKQQDLTDCGACSLSCIIKYYGGYVPIQKIREDTLTDHTGCTAYHLITAAKNYGFDAMGVKVDDIHDENIYFPAIAHVVLKNGLNHFVVIYKITKKEVYVMDPAKGLVKLKQQEFLEIWDHILILLNPISQILKCNKNQTISSLLWKLITNNKFIFIKICLINLFLMFFTILCSFYFQVSLSLIQTGQDISLLKLIVFLFASLTLFKVITFFIKNYYLTYFYKNLDVELFSDFLNHLFHLPLKYIQNRSTGEIISRVEDLSEVKDLLSEFFTNVLLNSVLIAGSIVVLYSLSSYLFFILCFIVILYILIGVLFSKVIYKNIKENITSATEFNTILVENIEMNTSIQNLNLIPSFYQRLEDKLILMLKSNFKTNKVLNRITSLKEFIYEIGLFLVMSVGIYLIFKNKLSLLHFITFNSILAYLFNPIKEGIDLIPKYNYLKAAFNKLSEFINVEEENRSIGLKNVKENTITFSDVSYSYQSLSNVLNHVSFTIRPGEKVALIGPSGSGKSTICSLLNKPDKLNTGIIKIGVVNLADYSLDALRNTILYVGQNEKLFTGSVWENITCFRDITEEEVLKVIKICELEKFMDERPNRYHTIINASINNLSGGEKQRIILARALLKKASILILDEALSEVDLSIEKKIIKNIKWNYKENTLIYISHKDIKREFQKIIDMEEINA